MTHLPLLSLEPYYKIVLWGGERIAALKDEASAGPTVGESWEVSDLEGRESVVVGGEYGGRTLRDVMEEHAEEILGPRLFRIYGKRFPLLVKLIDASDNLSIQVHPDDYLASSRHGSVGKTELWYTLRTLPGSYIYSGLQSTTTPERLRQHISDGTVEDLLAKFYPRHGDFFYIPAGRIHSIGAGTLLLEVQQPSDITYRIYDYKRLDLNGNPRELHTELALDAIDFRVHEDYMRHFEPVVNREIVLKECPYFTVTVINVLSKFSLPVARYNSFRVLVATSGSGVVTDDMGRSVELKQGHTILVPASTRRIQISPTAGELEVLTAYIQ
ncbi:MAG: class I mannose-6-phosphate isomerase [Muribaculaceae bacterium]|nr:class I mannose-6-phosphate isomerase [Muribaculaceae bacterium]